MEKTTADLCQFLIDKIQRKYKNKFNILLFVKDLCQFLIGKVQQPFLSASTHILFLFPFRIKFFPEKSPWTLYFSFTKKYCKFNAFPPHDL